jgi:hypothetical protein
MPFNGTGTFQRVYNWVTDLANGVFVRADRMDAEMDGIATGLSNCITRDGQGGAAANIPFNTYKITGLGAGAASTDSVNYGQVFSSPTIANPTFTGTVTVPTATVGDNSTKAASTAFAVALAFQAALPAQSGNSGKYITTDGSTASWGAITPTIKAPMAASRYYSYPFIATVANYPAAANRLYGIPVYISEACTVTKIGLETTAGNAGNARLGIYNMDSDALPSTLVLDAGTVTTTSTGEKEISISQALAAGWYFLGVVFDAGGAVSETRGIGTASNGSFIYGGSSAATLGTSVAPYVSHTYGALPSSFGTATLSTMTGASYPALWVRI